MHYRCVGPCNAGSKRMIRQNRASCLVPTGNPLLSSSSWLVRGEVLRSRWADIYQLPAIPVEVWTRPACREDRPCNTRGTVRPSSVDG